MLRGNDGSGQMLATLAFGLLLQGAASERPTDITAIRAVLDAKLRDYSAARFQEVSIVQRPSRPDISPVACGRVNGPNAAGGMTGWKRFVVVGTSLYSEGSATGDRALSVWCDAPDVAVVAADVTTAVSP
jgi:hypothetical protein